MDATQHSTTPVEQDHPNAATVQGLREAADWLDQHPELATPYYAAISFRSSYAPENAREDLTALAGALGERAEEHERNGEVEIVGHFGPVRISSAAKVNHLLDEPLPSKPEYRPIIEPVKDDALDVFA